MKSTVRPGDGPAGRRRQAAWAPAAVSRPAAIHVRGRKLRNLMEFPGRELHQIMANMWARVP
jgi:hypothetical protein